MKRSLIIVLLAALALASGQAQTARSVRAVVASERKAASAGQQIARRIEAQSRQTQQSVREAARRIKLKPSGVPSVIIPDLDTDDDKRTACLTPASKVKPITPHIPKLKPLPSPKSFKEIMDEVIAKEYDTFKSFVMKGLYDDNPKKLFLFADYAKRHNDEIFAVTCLERIRSEQVTPKLLENVMRSYPSLSEYMPEISRSVAICAYSMMLEAKLKGADCDSARMQSGDTLLLVTGQCNPSLNPLVVLSCFYDPSRLVERYKEAADSVTATYDQYSDAFKDTFARDFALTLMDNGEYDTALDYFGREPLKQFPDTGADYALDMASCALSTHNDSLFASYIERAHVLDSVAVNDYCARLYDWAWEYIIADPSQTGLADWLLENTPTPANNALILSGDIIERYWPESEQTWEWLERSRYSPEQETAQRTVFYIMDKGITLDEGRSEPIAALYISFIKAEMMMSDPTTVAETKSILDNLTASDHPDLRCRAMLGQAYLAAHGLDNPKEALKILKKNIKQLDNPDLTADTRALWYEYMAVLYTSLGKTKDAEKYLNMKEITK